MKIKDSGLEVYVRKQGVGRGHYVWEVFNEETDLYVGRGYGLSRSDAYKKGRKARKEWCDKH